MSEAEAEPVPFAGRVGWSKGSGKAEAQVVCILTGRLRRLQTDYRVGFVLISQSRFLLGSKRYLPQFC